MKAWQYDGMVTQHAGRHVKMRVHAPRWWQWHRYLWRVWVRLTQRYRAHGRITVTDSDGHQFELYAVED